MKKSVVSFLMLASLLAGTQMARAYEVTGYTVAIPVELGVTTSIVAVYVVVPTAIVTAASAATLNGGDDKTAYLNQLRDDAAEQVAEDGAPSALLANAISQIREQTGTTASDSELALAIVKALN